MLQSNCPYLLVIMVSNDTQKLDGGNEFSFVFWGCSHSVSRVKSRTVSRKTNETHHSTPRSDGDSASTKGSRTASPVTTKVVKAVRSRVAKMRVDSSVSWLYGI